MDGDRTFPAGSRRARVALLVAGAVVLLAAAVGVGAALGAAGGTTASLVERWGRSGPARPSPAKRPA